MRVRLHCLLEEGKGLFVAVLGSVNNLAKVFCETVGVGKFRNNSLTENLNKTVKVKTFETENTMKKQ